MKNCSRPRFALLLFALAAMSGLSLPGYSAPAASSAPTLDAVTASQSLRDGIEIRAGSALLQITALRDDILRIRISPERQLPETASWAVLERPRSKTVNVQPISDAASIGFRTAQLDVRVERSPLRLVVRDLALKVVCADAIGRPASFQPGGFTVYKDMPADEHYFGLGDKTGLFDRRNQAYTLWNRDIAPQEAIDPIYKSVPFFIAVNPTRSYGIFLDNTWRTWFDFGKQARNAYAFGAEGGPLDYYILYGPSPKQVVEAYGYLTGTPPLPPIWAFGFQQSRYSYTPDSQVREIANRLRQDQIPSDVIWLDIDYQFRNRPFTVDPKAFPDFPKLVADLRKQHFRTVTITDLHIAHAPNEGYAPYDSGHAGDHFVKNPDGSEYVGIVWPGPAVFPDFTRARTRDWWGSLYQQFVQDGVAGFWNDMNEPAVFDGPAFTMPLDSVHRIEEPGFAARTATHAEIHNIMGLENARATYEGLLKLRPEERPFVLTRATFAGGQRYGFTWTGDNTATWNHLRLAIQQVLNLGLSGISFVGADVGGFNESPAPELLTRWTQIAAFGPFFRNHSGKGTLPHEVWNAGSEKEAICRRYIETRYRLLPYIYTLAEEASRTGLPLMRPIFLEFPETISGFGGLDSEFLLGPSLLVAPQSFGETLDDYTVSYPKGQWFDFWTGAKAAIPPPEPSIAERVKAGPDADFPEPPRIHPTLGTLPVYVRGGSIVPLQPAIQNTDEVPQGPLELRVYPGSDCRGSIYLDDGHSFRYQQGEYLRQSFTCESAGKSIRVHFGARQGSYAPWWKNLDIVIYDWPTEGADAKLSTGTTPLKTSYDQASRALHVQLPDVAAEADLRIEQRAAQ